MRGKLADRGPALASRRQSLLHQFLDSIEDFVLAHVGRVEHDGILCGHQRRRLARAVAPVALTKFGSHRLRRCAFHLLLVPPPLPLSRCRATIHSRTLGWMDTRDAASVTSRSRMRAETSFPSRRTRWPPIERSSVMRESCAIFSSAASSSNEASPSIARNASARYIAPLSRLT